MHVMTRRLIRNALRLAYIEGTHQEMPESFFGACFACRWNTLWWTVYVLDRLFAAQSGALSSGVDDDITRVLLLSMDSCLTVIAVSFYQSYLAFWLRQ